MKKIWIIILIVVLISMVSFLCNVLMSAIMNGGNFMNMGFYRKVEKTEENIRKEEKVSLEQIQDLKLNFTSADINLIVTDDTEFKVIQYSNRELSEKELFSINKSSSKIEVLEGNLGARFSFNFFNLYRVSYDIYIPKSYSENLEMKTVSGDIKILEELELKNVELATTSGDIDIPSNLKAKNVEIKAVSGDINLGKIETQELTLETTSGDIEIETAENNVKAKSVSGDIEIENINGKLNAKTTSGNIKAYNFNITGETEINSTSGDVNFNIPETSNCKIETKTTSGNVRLPNGNSTIGTEPYNTVKVKTTSGNIHIEFYK